MEENHYLVESFCNSIGSDIVEFAGEAVEFTLDVCSGEDSILREVPFVGTAIKLYSIGSKVHEKHSFYKLKSFIKAVNTSTGKPGELEERREKFLTNAQFRKQELEYLLILIERYIGFVKPDMLGKLYVAYIDGIIDWHELTMYAEIVDRFLPGDYNKLQSSKQFITVHNLGSESLLRLMALGLLVEESQHGMWTDDGRGGFAVTTATMQRVAEREKKYVRTEFGQKLVEIMGRF